MRGLGVIHYCGKAQTVSEESLYKCFPNKLIVFMLFTLLIVSQFIHKENYLLTIIVDFYLGDLDIVVGKR